MTSIPPPGDDQQRTVSLSAPAPPPPPEDGGLTPLSKQLLQVVALLSVLLIAVVVYGWRSGDQDANPLSPVFNPIARAATRTERAPGMRMTIRGSISSTEIPGGVTIDGRGVYNGATGRSATTIAYAVAGRNVSTEVVGDARMAYVRSAMFAGRLPDGAEWLSVEADQSDSGEAAFGSSGNPRQQLQVLRSAGEVENLGPANLAGVSTTAYGGTVDLSDLADSLRDEGNDAAADLYSQMAEQVPDMNVNVWIDADGNVRQTEVLMPFPATDGHAAAAASVTIGLSDFGIKPKIKFPNPATVYRAGPVADGDAS